MDCITEPPKQRWYRKRKLICPIVLLVGSAIAFFAWDALFMPPDLRRMQGAWTIVQSTEDDNEIDTGNDQIIVTGRSITLVEKNGERRGGLAFEICPDRKELLLFAQEEMTVLGMCVHLPIWIKRPRAFRTVQYEQTGERLFLRFSLPISGTEVTTGVTTHLGWTKYKVVVERQ